MIKGYVGVSVPFGAGQDLASVRFPLVSLTVIMSEKTFSGFVVVVHCQENISIFLLET